MAQHVPCGRLSWLPVGFLLHVKYSLSYRIVSYRIHSTGANVPRSECSTGAKVLSMVFLLPGTKVQRNEKASYRPDCNSFFVQ